MSKVERLKKDDVKLMAKEGLGLQFNKDAEQLIADIDALVEILAKSLKENQKAPIGKYIVLEKQIKEEHKSRNPKTGEEITVPEKAVIKIKLTGVGQAVV